MAVTVGLLRFTESRLPGRCWVLYVMVVCFFSRLSMKSGAPLYRKLPLHRGSVFWCRCRLFGELHVARRSCKATKEPFVYDTCFNSVKRREERELMLRTATYIFMHVHNITRSQRNRSISNVLLFPFTRWYRSTFPSSGSLPSGDARPGSAPTDTPSQCTP